MTDSKAISDALRAPFDRSLLETKDGRPYLAHEHIRERVIEATGNCFDWLVTSEEYRMDGTNHQVENKRTKQMYTPIVHRVNGVLTIPGLGSRHGTGVQALQEGAGEDTYKAADSDAFKRAAMAFGVGLQLYVNGPSERGSSPTQQATASATTSAPINPDQFLQSWKIAFGTKSKEAIADSFTIAGTNLDLWQLMYESMPDRKTLAWLIDEMSKRGVEQSDTFRKGVDAYRSSLTA